MSNNKKQFGRRDFLKVSALSTLGFVGSMGLPLVGGSNRLADLIPEAEAAGETDHTLLLIFCRGSIDGLSMFPPSSADAQLRSLYEANRPNIKYDALPITGSAFGVNALIPELKELIVSKDMSVIFGFGSVNETTSHFNQMDHIEGGNSKRRLSKGFFQRAAEAAGWNQATDLVAIERTVPRSLAGQNFVFQYSGPDSVAALSNPANVTAGLDRSARLNNNYSGHHKIRTYASTLATVSEDVRARTSTVNITADIPLTDVKEAARLLKAGYNPKVMTVSISGWDFHADLTNRFTGPNGLGLRLAKSLKGLKQELGAAKWRKTTVVVMGEFGRRMVENGSRGTDHGRGGVALVLGGNINGGKMVADPNFVPQLKANYSDADNKQKQVPVLFDYRLLMNEILVKKLGLSAAALETVIYEDNVVANANYVQLIKA